MDEIKLRSKVYHKEEPQCVGFVIGFGINPDDMEDPVCWIKWIQVPINEKLYIGMEPPSQLVLIT